MKNTEKTDELVTLAARLADAREKAGLSAQEMAERLEVSFEEYAQWEAGIGEPDTETVRRAAAVLQVTGNYLLFGPTREGMVGAMFPNKARGFACVVRLYDGWGSSFVLRRCGHVSNAVYRRSRKNGWRAFVLFAVSGISGNMHCWRSTLHNSVDFAEQE